MAKNELPVSETVKRYVLVPGYTEPGGAGDISSIVMMRRLRAATIEALTRGSTIVVISIKSPFHPRQKQTLGEQMACHLRRKRCNVILLQGTTFNTEGEIEAFSTFLAGKPDAVGVLITGSYHISRITKLIQLPPYEAVRARLRYVSVPGEVPTDQERFREVLKLFSLYLPRSWRDKLGVLYRRWFG